MPKLLGLALLAVGILLLAMGISAADSVSSEISEFFTGSPTDKSIWLMIGGLVCITIGGGSLFFSGHQPVRT